MKRIIFLISFLLAIQIVFAQESPPPGLKTLTTATRYYNPADSAIWTYKGPTLGWHREGKYGDIQYLKLTNNSWEGINTYLPGNLRIFADGVGSSQYAPFLVSDYSDSGKLKSVGGMALNGDIVQIYRPFNISSQFDFSGQQPLFGHGFYTAIDEYHDFSTYHSSDSLKILAAIPSSIPDRQLGYVGYLPVNIVTGKKRIDSLQAKIDTTFIKDQGYSATTPQGGSFDIYGTGKLSQVKVRYPGATNAPETNIEPGSLIIEGNGLQSVLGFTGLRISEIDKFGALYSIIPKTPSTSFSSPSGYDTATVITGNMPIVFAQKVGSTIAPVDSIDVVRLKELKTFVKQASDSLFNNKNQWFEDNMFSKTILTGDPLSGTYGYFYDQGLGLSTPNGSLNFTTNSLNLTGNEGSFQVYANPGETDILGYPVYFSQARNRSTSHDPDDFVTKKELNGFADSTVTSNLYLKKSGDTLTGDLLLTSATPTNPLSAAPKAYIDNLVTGITWKNAVRAKSTGNVVLSGIQTIDGVTGISNGRYLLNNQTNTSQNGIWLMQSGAWTRPADADESSEINMSTIAVTGGNVNRNTQWTYIGTIDPIIGTDELSYGQISGAGTYTASNGINLSANVFTINESYSRSLFSGAGSIAYNATTGRFSAPTILSAFTNDAGYQTAIVADSKYQPLFSGAQGSIFFANASGQPTQKNSNLFWDNTNNRLGIGTNTPSRPLTVLSNQQEIMLMTGPNGNGLMLQDLPGRASFLGYNGTAYKPIEFRAQPGEGTQLNLTTDGKIGVNTIAPSAKLEILSGSGEGLRLSYDLANYTSFTTGSDGNLTINPSGTTMLLGANKSFGITGTGLIYANKYSNSASQNNALIQLNTTGTSITRNIADANPALVTNQANASSTGAIQTWQFSNTNIASMTSLGTLFLNTGIANLGSGNNALINVASTGTVISRNIADANAALVVNQANGASTGVIQAWQFGGSLQAAILNSGLIKAPAVANLSDANNSQLTMASTGLVATRNVADANAALTVNLQNVSSTGSIANFNFNGSTVAQVDKNGRYYATGFGNIANSANGFFSFGTNPTLSRNIADANPVLTIKQQNTSATGPLQIWSNTGGDRSQINLSGEYENLLSSGGIILKSADGTRYRITVANGGAIQTSAL